MTDLIKASDGESGHFIQPQTWVATEAYESGSQLRHYSRVLLKHKWLISATILTCIGLAALYSYTRVPYFKSTAVIEFEPEPTLPFLYSGTQPEITQTLDEPYLRTRYNILKSRDLSMRVVRRLELDRDSGFNTIPNSGGWKGTLLSLASPIRTWISGRDEAKKGPEIEEKTEIKEETSTDISSRSAAEDPPGDSEKLIVLADRLRSNLWVTPVDGTRLVDIAYTSPVAKLSAKIVNTLADEAIQLNFETHLEATRRATEFLKSQMLEMQMQVEESQEKLLSYARTFNLLDIEEGENIVLQKLEFLSSTLTRVETQLISESPRLERIKNASLENFPEPLQDDTIRGLETNMLQLNRQLSSLRGRFGPRWQPMIELKEQIKEVEQQLRVAKSKAIVHARLEHEDQLVRLENLSLALETQQQIAEGLKKDSIQYNILKDEVDSNKRIYETLLHRMKEASVVAGLKSSNVHIVDQGVVPNAPFKPDHHQNLLIALALGSVLGIGLAILLESLDNTLTTPEEVETMGLPSLGFIPTTHGIMKARATRRLGRGRKGSAADVLDFNPYVKLNPRMWEAFRSLRTSLLLSGSGQPPQRILVTSAFAGEGKTTTVAHTGIVLSQTRARTLVLDMDLRRPSLGAMFSCDRESLGLSDFLNGRCTLSSTIRPTGSDDLFILPSGSIPHNPAELLGSERMHQALAMLSRVFVYIVIDSPPLLDVTDAMVLSPQVDGVVLVAKGSSTTKVAVKKSSRHLASVGARMLGVVINNVDLTKSEHYYYYSQYYDGRQEKQ